MRFAFRFCIFVVLLLKDFILQNEGYSGAIMEICEETGSGEFIKLHGQLLLTAAVRMFKRRLHSPVKVDESHLSSS